MQKLLDTLFGNRRGRWIIVICLFFLAMIFLVIAASPPDQDLHRTVGLVTLGLFVLALIGASIREAQRWPAIRANRALARAARTALRSGRAMAIPPLPQVAQALPLATVEQTEDFTAEMVDVPWGRQVAYSAAETRAVFDHTVGAVRRVAGDWRKFAEPIRIFAQMAEPWCYIGAAEIMLRLSYIRNGVHVPQGLRQGLRFVALAQAAEPENPDALVIRAKLLAGYPDKRWLRLAEQTLERLQAIAPNHPRLPEAEYRLFDQYGEYDKALACLERLIAHPATPDEEYAARTGKAMILMNMGRYEESAAAYHTIIQDWDDKDPWVWHNLSIVLSQLGRYDEALRANQRALAIMPFSAAFELTPKLEAKLRQGAHGMA